MADQKLTQLTELTDVALEDLVYVVDDPGGTPASRKATLESLLGSIQRNMSWWVQMAGVNTPAFELTGEFREFTTGETATWNAGEGAGNQHVFLQVNSLTGSGDVVVTGTSVAESTALPVASDTETITVDTAGGQYYQTDKKWLEVDSVTIPGGISAINYDIGVVGYLDWGNKDATVVGYRFEARSSSNQGDVALRLRKVQDDGSKKMSIVDMEEFGWDSGVGGGDYNDNFRTGGDDRSYAMVSVSLTESDHMVVLKMLDFETFFSSDENVMECSTKAEGLIIDFLGSPSGNINNVDHVTLTLYYKLKA